MPKDEDIEAMLFGGFILFIICAIVFSVGAVAFVTIKDWLISVL